MQRMLPMMPDLTMREMLSKQNRIPYICFRAR